MGPAGLDRDKNVAPTGMAYERAISSEICGRGIPAPIRDGLDRDKNVAPTGMACERAIGSEICGTPTFGRGIRAGLARHF
jgi:hypothetical protein